MTGSIRTSNWYLAKQKKGNTFMNRILWLSLCLFLCVFHAEAIGKVSVKYAKPSNKSESTLQAQIKNSGTVDAVTEFITDHFKLPEKLTFYFGSDDGPLFDSSQNRIEIPYEFITDVKQRFAKAKYQETGVSVEDATYDALMHTLFHEFAHAAIWMYELPILGKEEDAADALATLLLIEYFEGGQELALSAADLFDLESQDRNVLEEPDFWGEHSLDEQRFFGTLCQVYGSDPEQYGSIVKDGFLSQDRAELCVEEYDILLQSWSTLVKYHIQFKSSAKL